MTTGRKPETLLPQDSSGAKGRDAALIKQISESLRRVDGDESFDKHGIRTIWHRGSMHTELLTWENKNHEIVKQELCFVGLVVELKEGEPLRTGRVHKKDEEGSNPGAQITHDIRLEGAPTPSTLERAWQLLRLVPERDFYVQHLLQKVGESLATMGHGDDRTAVAASPDDFSRAPKKKPQKNVKVPKVKIAKPKTKLKPGAVMRAVVGFLVLAGLGSILAYLVWLST